LSPCYGVGAVAEQTTAPLVNAQPDEVADRGTLTVRDRVAERIATRAALETAGVQRYSGRLGRLTRNELPRSHVVIAGGRVRAAVNIAVPWTQPLPAVAQAVRANVGEALSTLVGLQVDAVDVSIDHVGRGLMRRIGDNGAKTAPLNIGDQHVT